MAAESGRRALTLARYSVRLTAPVRPRNRKEATSDPAHRRGRTSPQALVARRPADRGIRAHRAFVGGVLVLRGIEGRSSPRRLAWTRGPIRAYLQLRITDIRRLSFPHRGSLRRPFRP